MDTSIEILIVEDRGIIAAKVKRELERAGFAVAGVAASTATATDLAGRLSIQAAILDIDLRGEPVYPIADILHGRGIPFLFLTGYGRAALPDPWKMVQLVEKPFEADTLISALRLALAGKAASPSGARTTSPAILRARDTVRHRRDLLTEQRAWAETREQPKLD